MEKVVIYGTGFHAQLVAHEMKINNLFDVIAFTVEKKFYNQTELLDLPVIDFEKLPLSHSPKEYKMFIAIGPQYMNRTRERIYYEAEQKNYDFVNCISPYLHLPHTFSIGKNVYIDRHSKVSDFVEIGNNVIIIGSLIGHHSKIADHCFLSVSTLGGNVEVRKNVFMGLNSSIAPNLVIEKATAVGMNCAITKNTKPNSVFLNKGTKEQDFGSEKLKLL